MFRTISLTFDAYDTLDIADGPRWLLVRLARHANRDGVCFPGMRGLAQAARKSLATICRWLKILEAEGCFTRTREAGRVYHYQLAEAYRLHWAGQEKPPKSEAPQAPPQGVSPEKQGVSHGATQEVKPLKQEERRAPAREAAPPAAPSPAASTPTRQQWASWVAFWAKMRGRSIYSCWRPDLGPTPDHPGCLAPADLITAYQPKTGQERP